MKSVTKIVCVGGGDDVVSVGVVGKGFPVAKWDFVAKKKNMKVKNISTRIYICIYLHFYVIVKVNRSSFCVSKL